MPRLSQSLASDSALQRRNREMLEESIAELLRVLSESADPRRPLRVIAERQEEPKEQSLDASLD